MVQISISLTVGNVIGGGIFITGLPSGKELPYSVRNFGSE